MLFVPNEDEAQAVLDTAAPRLVGGACGGTGYDGREQSHPRLDPRGPPDPRQPRPEPDRVGGEAVLAALQTFALNGRRLLPAMKGKETAYGCCQR